MIRFSINDRYIKGMVAFHSEGGTAVMSYVGQPTVPVNSQYEIEGKKWKVVQARVSDFNDRVTNVDMVLVAD